MDFAEEIGAATFDRRKAELMAKGASGRLRVDLVKDRAGQALGYCVASIDEQKVGEIDSIYVEPHLRNQAIGDALMRRALSWMDEHGIQTRILSVAAGNERVESFYRRHGFLPRSVIWRQKAR